MSAALHAWLLWPRALPEKPRSQAMSARLLPSVEVGQAVKQAVRPVAVKPAATRLEPAPSAGTAASAGPALPAREAVPEPATLALPSTAQGVDASGLRSYRTALALGLRRSGAFVQGIGSGMRGRLEAEIVLSAQGQVIALGISRSSGNEGLDALAIRALGEIAPQTALPPVLLGQVFRVAVPLEVD